MKGKNIELDADICQAAREKINHIILTRRAGGQIARMRRASSRQSRNASNHIPA